MTKKKIAEQISSIQASAEHQINFLNEFGEEYPMTRANLFIYKMYLASETEEKRAEMKAELSNFPFDV